MSTSTTNLPLGETIAPADQAAVAEAVRNAGSQGLAVYPRGGGTRLDYGVKPQRPGIALSLTNLNRVVDYPAADLTITVEAGTTIAELTKRLASQRQQLPIDIPQPDRATVGGAVAVNAAGPRRYAYGTIRDYLLGFTAVDGVGGTFSGGGRVVKNAAGYNMCRLMTGSLGTLGVITQATLMVRPLAEASALVVCDVADLETAEKLLAGLIQSPTRPVAIDFVAGQPADETVLGPMSAGTVGRLYVGFEGAAAEVDWMVEQLRQEWAALGATAPMLVPAAQTESLWRWLADFAADVQINVLPSAVVSTMAKILPLDPKCAIQTHAGDGVIRVRLPLLLGDGQSEEVSAAHPIGQLRQIATAAGGTMIVLGRPGSAHLTAADVWGPPGPELGVMQAIKDRFDPQNILNPGRFIY